MLACLSHWLLPRAHETILIVGFRHRGPALAARTLLPELLQMFECLIATQAAADQITADGRPRTTDARVTVHIHASTRIDRALDRIENLCHVLTRPRHAMIRDRPAMMLDRR